MFETSKRSSRHSTCPDNSLPRFKTRDSSLARAFLLFGRRSLSFWSAAAFHMFFVESPRDHVYALCGSFGPPAPRALTPPQMLHYIHAVKDNLPETPTLLLNYMPPSHVTPIHRTNALISWCASSPIQRGSHENWHAQARRRAAGLFVSSSGPNRCWQAPRKPVPCGGKAHAPTTRSSAAQTAFLSTLSPPLPPLPPPAPPRGKAHPRPSTRTEPSTPLSSSPA